VLGNNKPLHGWKGEVYEGGIRVPAMANWPGVLKPGTLAVPVHIVDWMPTLCGLVAEHAVRSGSLPDSGPARTGVPSGSEGPSPKADLKWDGRDVWASVSKGTAPDEPRLFYWRTPNASAVRLGDWKLIVQKKGNGSTGSPSRARSREGAELYDVTSDPYEEHDLAQQHPDRVKDLRQRLAALSADDR
jgi:arylsulfatase A-like enzyme